MDEGQETPGVDVVINYFNAKFIHSFGFGLTNFFDRVPAKSKPVYIAN